MRVLKFGGTSIGTAERMQSVANLVLGTPGRKIVVLSAVSGTTNALVSILEAFQAGDQRLVLEQISDLRNSYLQYIDALFQQEHRDDGHKIVDKYFEEIGRLVRQPYYDQIAKIVVVVGELISTELFALYLRTLEERSKLIPAMDFMYLNTEGDPDMEVIATRLKQRLEPESETFITQGFICRNANGGTDNLRRGGSDYSATLIGAALGAEEVQIWTDIDGMHNNDPRVVEKTNPIAKLSFEEASELAYFGAKILHPHCIIPAYQYNIPVRIKNTMKPDAPGSLINSERNPIGVKAIAAKSGITAVKIKSSRMIMAYGFLRKVFEVFEKHKTPIDMITTSEVAISLTIDDPTFLDQIQSEIEAYGKVEVDKDQTIICVVGDMVAEKTGIGSQILNALHHIPIRMISYGGSKNNISLLIVTSYKKEALNALNVGLF